MARRICIFLALLITAFLSRAEDANPYTITAQPSIFWRNGAWQTFQDGQWVPYSASKQPEAPTEHQMVIEPLPFPQPENIQTNDYPADYSEYWGYGYPSGFSLHGHHFSKRHHSPARRDDPFFQQPIAGLGRTTIGIGQQSGSIGQTTIGIGQPTIGIGQPNGGIGQTTIGIGQPNFAVGRVTPAIGQPNSRLGQTTITMGQPSTSTSQRRIGIGQHSGTSWHAAPHSEGNHR